MEFSIQDDVKREMGQGGRIIDARHPNSEQPASSNLHSASATAPLLCSRSPLMTTSRQDEKSTAREDQTRQSCTDDGARYRYQFTKSNLRYVVQTNCSCERNARDKFAARSCKREEVLPSSTEGK
jgi:hypothetical protein